MQNRAKTSRIIAAAVAAATLGITSAAAAQITLHWDHPSTTGPGGSGNWFDAEAWRLGGPLGPRQMWDNGLDANAFLGGPLTAVPAAASLITLDSNVIAANLHIRFLGGGVPGYTLSGPGSLTLTGGGAGPAVINTWHSGFASAASNINTVIAGSNGLTKMGHGVLNLSANNTISGPINLTRGLTQLHGAQGALAGGSSYAIRPHTELRLNNDGAGNNNNNRIGSTAPWTAHGGLIRLIGNEGSNTHQQMGAFDLASGTTDFAITIAETGTTQLSLAGMTRSTPHATANFRVQVHPTGEPGFNPAGVPLGASSTSPRVNIPGLSNDSSNGGGIIGGWATVSSATSSTAPHLRNLISWAKIDDFGIRPMLPGELVGAENSEYDERTPASMETSGNHGTLNVNISGGGTAFMDDHLTINSVRFFGATTTVIGRVGDFRTLTLNSGGVIVESGSHGFAGGGAMRIQPGPDNAFYVHVAEGATYDGNARWRNGAAATALIKSGPGLFLLKGDSGTDNTYSAGTFINEGTLRLDHVLAVPIRPIPDGPTRENISPFVVNGGTFQLNIPEELTKNVHANSGTLQSFGGNRTWGNIIVGNAPGSVVTFTGPNAHGGFVVNGAISGGGGQATIVVNTEGGIGRVSLTQAGTFDGTWFMSRGQLTQFAEGGLGSGNVRLDGDNLGAVVMVHGQPTNIAGLSGQFTLGNYSSSSSTTNVNIGAGRHDTFAGNIVNGSSGSFNLIKSGDGDLTLAGSMTQSGNIRVDSGTVNINGTWAPVGNAGLISNGGVTNVNVNSGTPATASDPAVVRLIVHANGGLVNFGTDQDLRGAFTTGGRINLGGHQARLYPADQSAALTGLLSDLATGSTTTDDGIWDHTIVAGQAVGYIVENDAFGTSHIRVNKTFAGDANLDGQVTIADLSLLASNWQRGVSDGLEAFWSHGDFNYDGQVTIADLSLLASNWQAGVPADAPMMSFAEALAMFDVFNGVVIPEPSSLGLLGLAGMLALRRRR